MSNLDVKFADMPPGVRQRWLDWARSHDWGGRNTPYFDTDNELVVFGLAHDGVAWFEERAVHATPRELRDWAGY